MEENLKHVYELESDIPDTYRSLYDLDNGKYVLSKIDGIETVDSVANLRRALKNTRDELRKMKSDSAPAPAPITENEIVPEIPKSENVNLETAKLSQELKQALEKIETYKIRERERSISDETRRVSSKMGIVDTAVEDVILNAERFFEYSDGMVLTSGKHGQEAGLSLEAWISRMKECRPHWFGITQGSGGSKSSSSSEPFHQSNPWTDKNWNLDEQAQIYRKDQELAKKLAKAAGKPLFPSSTI